MRIGELAQATKISVRTLHHYDEVGVLKPSARSEAGHRIYTEADIARLHKIMSLRSVGFSLDEINQFVGKSQEELNELAARQMEKLEAELEENERRKWCLKAAVEASQWKTYEGTETLLNLIRELNLQSQYFSKDDREMIQKMNDLIGPERAKEMHEKQAELVKKVREFMNSNVPVQDPRAVEVAKEWIALGKEGVGDNPELVKKIKAMFAANPQMAAYRGVTPDVIQYLKAASQVPGT